MLGSGVSVEMSSVAFVSSVAWAASGPCVPVTARGWVGVGGGVPLLSFCFHGKRGESFSSMFICERTVLCRYFFEIEVC